MTGRNCSIEGCGKMAHQSGMCGMHVYRKAKGLNMHAPPRTYIRGDPERAFWSRVLKSNECWVWTGALSHGYGRVTVGRREEMAHRYSYVLEYGSIPGGMVIDHMCHNPACVRPDHLRACTQKQNLEHRTGAQRNNRSSGVRGVTWDKQRKKWVAQVKHNGRRIYVGIYPSIAEADAAVSAKRIELFTHNLADRGPA